jgi:leucyl-tRNA---protein transferase
VPVSSKKPSLIDAPAELPELGGLVVVDGECAYFDDGRASRTAFAMPRPLTQVAYRQAMHLGMRRSGTLVYRPLCVNCRRCQPIRVDIARFTPSRSQKRVSKRCEGRFSVEMRRPQITHAHLELYRAYQRDQHKDEGQQTDAESYGRFLCETVADTWELAWTDSEGKLVAVGIVDMVDDGISSVYFYWDTALRDFSLGVFSALYEIELCTRFHKPYYYLGYLVDACPAMAYKAQFAGAEVWDGDAWHPIARDLRDVDTQRTLRDAERASTIADDKRFPLR